MDAGFTGSLSKVKAHNPSAAFQLYVRVLQPPAGPRTYLGADGSS